MSRPTRDQFMATLFEPNEPVVDGNMYATMAGPQAEVVGPFISINTIKDKRLDSNVTSFRNFLVELDVPGLSIDDQLKLCSQLPYSTATYSGSKSVHFIVSLETPLENEKIWRQWAAALIKSIPGADLATKNPSRFTRLPSVIRNDTGKEQKLLAVRSRIPNIRVEAYVKPYLVIENNFRSLYSNLRGLKGVAAMHPMTRAFINGTHPCPHGRNNALFKSAADMASNMPYEEIMASLLPPALALGLSEQEATRTILSAFQKASRAS